MSVRMLLIPISELWSSQAPEATAVLEADSDWPVSGAVPFCVLGEGANW
jgi:hypothetical protein